MEEIDFETILKTLIPFLFIFGGSILRFMRKIMRLQQQNRAPAQKPVVETEAIQWPDEDDEFELEHEVPQDLHAAAGDGPAGLALVPPPIDEGAALRNQLGQLVAAERKRAKELAEVMQHEQQNRRFLDTLRDYVPALLREAELAIGSHGRDQFAFARIEDAEMILDVVETLGRQRRDQTLGPMVGDADRLAEVCYRPIVDFARSQNLPLASAHPATIFGDFDLGIWVGFSPTAIAPIFLPRDFFRRTAWWPAIAHEIGHDFLVSVKGLDEQMRRELHLVSEEEGSKMIGEIASMAELTEAVERLFSVWFEEIFCDVFGAMMLGPSYLAAMSELFSSPDEPHRVLSVSLDPEAPHRYDVHPPRHLRFMISAMVLDQVGVREQVRPLQKEWIALHTVGKEPPKSLFIPGRGGWVEAPIEKFLDVAKRMVDRLRLGPMRSLGAHGLRDIIGLDFGPHRAAEADGARLELLAGTVPHGHDPRAIIAGAVMAAREERSREDEFLRLAQQAIPALDTFERRPDDVYRIGGGGLGTRSDIVEAVILGEVFSQRRTMGR